MGVESYKHKFAKDVLAGWLREVAAPCGNEWVSLEPIRWRVNRGGPHFGVWTEYPVCLNDENNVVGVTNVWDEFSLHYLGEDRDYPPTYEECIKAKLLPICIFDVAIQHKGSIAYGLEVVHKNKPSDIKLQYLDRLRYAEVYTIDADWILSRTKRPEKLVLERIR